MRKFIFGLTALCSAMILSFSSFAEAQVTAEPPVTEQVSTADCVQNPDFSLIGNSEQETLHKFSKYILSDNAGVLDENQISEAESFIQITSEIVGYNIGVVITDDIGSDKSDSAAVRLADKYYDVFFGEGTDGVLFLINNDTQFDVISTSGRCIAMYTSPRLNEIFSVTDAELSNGNYYDAIESFCGFSIIYATNESDEQKVVTGEKQGLTVEYTADSICAALYDPDNVFGEDTQTLINLLKATSEEVGYNICAAVVSDVGADKSDQGVELFADELYDYICGKYTDGILLLINNDTKYDYLTTSGICIDLYTSKRIDELFDIITPIISDGDYTDAITGFCLRAKNLGKTEDPYAERYYDDRYAERYYDDRSGEDKLSYIIVSFISALIVAALVFIIIVQCVKSSYAFRPSKGAKNYIWRSSLKFTEKSDNFLHSYTTRVSVSTSSGGHRSGGGHSHGGGGHHRSGGGRSHGGGGRHR